MDNESSKTEVILKVDPPVREGSGASTDYLSDETPRESRERMKEFAAMRDILDHQSIIQFRQYAQEQHPKDPAKQEELVKQMQDQHFRYYMENVQQSQFVNQQRQIEQLLDIRKSARTNAESGEDPEAAESEEMSGDPIPLPLVPASVWTRKDITEFKKDILANQRECCIKIASLASATLRVPTHDQGTSIFWEFATDGYDLGFGLYFEWSLTPPDNITMTISESSDEEDEEDDEVEEEEEEEEKGEDSETDKRNLPCSDGGPGDVESGSGEGGRRRRRRRRRRGSGGEGGGVRDYSPPTDELIPVYRRDCHSEVYCGSHQYPGCGVYVFKFDNSFSLWRSKWLYYRVYYGE